MVVITVALIFFILFLRLFYIVVSLKDKSLLKVNMDSQEKGIAIICVTNNVEYIANDFINNIATINYTNFEGIVVIDENFENIVEKLNLVRIPKKVNNGDFIYNKVKGVFSPKGYSNIFVIFKDKNCKEEALNAASDFTNKETILVIGENCILHKSSLKYINDTFDDNRIEAVTGSLIVNSGVKNKVIFSEYETFQSAYRYLVEKDIQQKYGELTVISNEFTAFRKDLLIDIGGFKDDIKSGMDMTCRIREYLSQGRESKKIKFIPQAVCYLKVDKKIKEYFRDRIAKQRLFINLLDNKLNEILLSVENKYDMIFLLDKYIVSLLIGFLEINLLIASIYYNNEIKLIIGTVLTLFILSLVKIFITINTVYRYGSKVKINELIKILCRIPITDIYHKIIGLTTNIISIIDYLITFNSKKEIKKEKENFTKV